MGGELVTEPTRGPGDEPRTQPWVYAMAAIVLLGLVLLFVVMHLAGAVPSH